MSGTNNRKFYTYDSFIFCPVGHKNVSGLDECASCNMPLINFRKELSTLISNLESINGEKHNKIINFGLGTFGSQILLSLKNDFGSEQLFNYLMIDYEGSNVDSLIPDNDDSLEHNSYSVANDYDSKTNIWSNFENNFSQFDQLEDKIRRIGLNNNIDEQTAILTGSMGETLVSGMTPPLLKKIKQINPKTSRLVLTSLPATSDTDQVHFNAFCGVSRFIRNQKTSGDILVVLQGDALEKMIGIDRSGKKLGSDFLIPRMVNLLTNNSSAINSLSKIAKSLKVLAFAPVYVYGRSYEIYDNLKNILDDAAYFPLSPFQYESVILNVIIVRAPENVLNVVSKKRIEADCNLWNRKRFPSLKESLVYVLPVKETSDRLDVLLLLGGAKLQNIIQSVQPGYERFKEYIRERDLWDEFQINEDDLKKFENTITSYDKNLAKLLKPN